MPLVAKTACCSTLKTLVWQLGTSRAEEKVQCVSSVSDQKGTAESMALTL